LALPSSAAKARSRASALARALAPCSACPSRRSRSPTAAVPAAAARPAIASSIGSAGALAATAPSLVVDPNANVMQLQRKAAPVRL